MGAILMRLPANFLYTATHEWVNIEGDEAIIGITYFAQRGLGNITYLNLPEIGSTVAVGDEFCAIESVKAASEVYSPVNGEVIAVNEALVDNPELINQAPYDKGWIMRVKLTAKPTDLLDAKSYGPLCVDDH